MVRVGVLEAAAALLCLTALTGSASAVNCYVCTAAAGVNIGGTCTDPLPSSGVTNVTGCTTCSKIYTSISGVTTYTRACWPTSQTAGCTSTTVASLTTTTCYCSTDLCNSATLPAASTGSFLAVCALVAVRYAL